MPSPAYFNERCANGLPGLLGVKVVHTAPSELRAELAVNPSLLAPNGFLHAGSVVTLADTACGNACLGSLPEGASGFTTLELKSNHLGTATQGVIACTARPVHLGRTTQVWDAEVTDRDSGKTIAVFRCTQLILYAKPGAAASNESGQASDGLGTDTDSRSSGVQQDRG